MPNPTFVLVNQTLAKRNKKKKNIHVIPYMGVDPLPSLS